MDTLDAEGRVSTGFWDARCPGNIATSAGVHLTCTNWHKQSSVSVASANLRGQSVSGPRPTEESKCCGHTTPARGTGSVNEFCWTADAYRHEEMTGASQHLTDECALQVCEAEVSRGPIHLAPSWQRLAGATALV